MRASLISIPGGDLGTHATLYHMKRLARAGSIAPLVRQTAIDITYGMGGDPTAQARVLREWLAVSILFQRDPRGTEALHDPVVVLRAILTRGTASVDCDDVAMLAAAMGLSLGLRARFVVVGFSPTGPFRHVWTDLADPRPSAPGWVECDITRPAQHIVASMVKRRLVVEV